MSANLTVRVLPLHQAPRRPIYIRLGFREDAVGGAADAFRGRVERMIAETPVRVFHREADVRVSGETVTVGDYAFASAMVARKFGHPARVLIMGASALPESVARRDDLEARGDLARAVMLDAVLSEKTDCALDLVEKELAGEWRRRGWVAGRRLSCGYGDFALVHQRFFYAQLEFARYGITMDERFILHPEKTVTALLPLYAGG